jgi:membrane-bound inhibitor of C-type lysozyme
VSVVQRGFCPTTLTVAAREGPKAGVFFPIGTLPLGTYDVTVTEPAQTVNEAQGPVSWLGVQVKGTLRVGTMFTEMDAHALVTPGRNAFAAVLRNSFAGSGAGEFVWSKNGNTARLTGTDYYACGTINVTATVTYGKRGANALVRLRGKGSLAGGTGNYKGIKGAFTLQGSYSAKRDRGTFALSGEATF